MCGFVTSGYRHESGHVDESGEHAPEKNKAISYERPCVTVISPWVRGGL